MNYGEYMRKKEIASAKIIGYQMRQDASQVTLKNQALATTVTLSSLLSSNTSFTGVPFTTETSDANSCTRVSGGAGNVDASRNLIGYAQMATISLNTAPAFTLIPCTPMLSTITNAPSTKSCVADPGQIFRNPTELIANQARQASLRSQYNLPSKLDSLRGPIANIR